MKTKHIIARQILSTLKKGSDTFFGIRYNMNLYRGCSHACIYCDSRSSCYQIADFDQVEIKINSLELLERELRSKRERGTIGFGSMNDPYMPVEATQLLCRKALTLALRYRFPVHIITKSTLVERDIDLLKEIGRVYAAVSITITTADDKCASDIEPCAPVSSARFETIRRLSEAGIYCGILLTPVLPYITDTEANIQQIVALAAQAGAHYIQCWPGVTVRDGQREYFYAALDRLYPGMSHRYQQRFADSYNCVPDNSDQLQSAFVAKCKALGVSTKMKFYEPNIAKQLSLFDD